MARHQEHLSRKRPAEHCNARRGNKPALRLLTRLLPLFALFSLVAGLLAPIGEASAANRSLTLHNTHTKETTTITFKRNGRFDADGLRQLNRFLRDWRRNESTQMDPALFDLIWEVYKQTGAKKPINVVSGYRSPATNNMLRGRSRGVAKNSRHTKGQAMDFYLPGVPISKIRNVGLRLQAGGVGYYPGSRSPFVHIDTGNVRHWPRMTRKQLAKVFPDGKTVHVPTDGKPFSGYKVAKVQVDKRKADMIRSSRSVRRFSQVAKAAPAKSAPVKVASAAAQQPKQSGTLLQRLLNRTPKSAPTPEFSKQQDTTPVIVAQPAPEDVQSSMPVKLAALPKRPQNRPTPTAEPEVPADLDLAVAQTEAETEDELTPQPVLLAALPQKRPDNLVPATFEVASAEPAPEPKTIEELAQAQNAERAAKTENQVAQTVPEQLPAVANEDDGRITLASLPQARLSVPDPNTTASLPAPEADETASTAQEALNQLTPSGVAEQQQAETPNRFAYASSDRTFLATLPSKRPSTILSKSNPEDSLATLPKDSNRPQLAALPKTPEPSPTNRRTNTAPTIALQSDQLARLTFAYGPSGMSHFAHMKQSTKTATFARLSRPIPNNLRALMSKPNSVINQTFGNQAGQFVADTYFAGPAIARMSVRSFN